MIDALAGDDRIGAGQAGRTSVNGDEGYDRDLGRLRVPDQLHGGLGDDRCGAATATTRRGARTATT